MHAPFENMRVVSLGLAGFLLVLLIIVLVLLVRAIRQQQAQAAVPPPPEPHVPEDEDPDLTRLKAFSPAMLPKLSLDDPDDEDDSPAEDSVPELRYESDAQGEEHTGPHELIAIAAAGQTDKGMKRRRNEDAVLVDSALDLYVVADGMGGYAGGDFASVTAVNEVRNAISKNKPVKAENGYPPRGRELVSAVEAANEAVFKYASKRQDLAGMGTTVLSARFSKKKQRVYIAHVGDSRCYRLRGGKLQLMTIDHTLGAKGVTGPLAADVRRAVGVAAKVKVDLLVDKPVPTDLYLLCSDGMYKMVKEEQVVRILSEQRSDLTVAAAALISAANAAGGKDNISVVLIEVREPSHTSRSDARVAEARA